MFEEDSYQELVTLLLEVLQTKAGLSLQDATYFVHQYADDYATLWYAGTMETWSYCQP